MSFGPRSVPTDRPWQQGGEEPVSFGTWLRRQREVREISLREIADASKIGLRYLEAFEQDRFDVLPARVFARGFLREYAKYVGLDPDEVVNHFLSALQALEPEDEEGQEAPEESRRPGWALNLLLVLAVLAIIVLVGLVAFYAERSGGEDAAGGTPAPASVGAPVPAPAPSDGDGGAPAVPQPEVQSAAIAPPQAIPEAPLTITLDFVDDCWVEVVADGGRQLRRRASAGETMRIEANRRVVMTLGNGGGVEVRVNGLPFDQEWRIGQVVRGVTIDLATARALAEGA